MEEEERRRQAELLRKHALKQILTSEAYERLMNVKIANPELYELVSSLLINLVNTGRLKPKVDEETLKKVIIKVKERTERKTKIIFRRK